MRFIKVYELKLTQVDLFSYFHFKFVTSIASELLYVALEANKEQNLLNMFE